MITYSGRFNFEVPDRKTTSRASHPSLLLRGTRTFKFRITIKTQTKTKATTTTKTKTEANHHKMSCPSGIIRLVQRSVVGSTDSKGWATRQ